MDYDIICSQVLASRCGFRAHKRYFVEKKRFAPGVCPRTNCGSPVLVVEKATNHQVNWFVDLKTGEIRQNESALP